MDSGDARYVLLDMGGWHMALPQEEVVSVELLSDAICTRVEGKLEWWLSWKGHRVAVFAMDYQGDNLDVEEFMGNTLVLLGDDVPALSIACHNMEVLAEGEVHNITLVPTIMSPAKVLFTHLAQRQDMLLCMSELAKLAPYLLDKQP